MGYIGFLMFMLGASAVDGDRMVLAGIISIAGLGLIAIDSKIKNFADHRPKQIAKFKKITKPCYLPTFQHGLEGKTMKKECKNCARRKGCNTLDKTREMPCKDYKRERRKNVR